VKKMNKEFNKNNRKFNDKKGKSFTNKADKPFAQTVRDKPFNTLEKEDVKQRMGFKCRIEEIKQTSGPTVFTLYDGSATIKATGFVSPGKRAYPEFDISDYIDIFAEVSVRDDEVELEIIKAHKLDNGELKEISEKIQAMENEKAQPDNVDFLVDSEIMRALKPRMKKVTEIIKRAIFSNRPIILKHHNDCDGYSSGIALERAILPLILEHHMSNTAGRMYFKRTPMKAPFYEYMDAVKDISMFIDDHKNYGQQPPLIILTDNGSTEEDLLSIKAVKIYGADVVVIDHHYPGEVVDGKVAVDEYVTAHVNPYLEGYDSTMCAGILGTEISRMINKNVTNVDHIPGIAATADRVKGVEVDKYKELTRKYGYTDDDMQTLTEIIDFQSYYLRFMEARGLVNSLFGEDNFIKQREIMRLVGHEIKERNQAALKAARHYMHVEEHNGTMIMTLDADKITSRGQFPAIGKVVGMTHDSLKQENPGKPIISMGLGPDFITLRMTDEADFKVGEIVKMLQEKVPYGNVDGGGHEHAGSLKFLEAAREEIHSIVFALLRNEQ
jgi:RecJ-like exonuclease